MLTCGRDVIDPNILADIRLARAMAVLFAGIVLGLVWSCF